MTLDKHTPYKHKTNTRDRVEMPGMQEAYPAESGQTGAKAGR